MSAPGNAVAPAPVRSVGRLGTNSAVFALATLTGRALNFLLVPLFTRVLTPADYGVLAVAAMTGGLLITLLSLSIEASVLQMHTRPEDADARSRLYGSIVAFWIVGSGAIALALQAAWSLGAMPPVFGRAFEPYFPLVLWSSYLGIFPLLPAAIFTARQQAGRAALLTIGPSVLATLLTVLFVAVLRQGVAGNFRAALVASAASAAVSVAVLARITPLRLARSAILRALRFSLPLVPHTAANWALSLSDRWVLEKFVPTSEVGLYLLGYQFGSLTLIAGSSINSALVPIVNACLDDASRRDEVPRLGTFAFSAIAFCGVGVAVFGSDAIRLLTPAGYHAASRIVPWIAAGFVVQGAYLVVSRGSFYVQNTSRIPFLTGTAALANVALNVALVPRFGIVAAAVNMVASYAVLALLHGWMAHRLYPIPWQYRSFATVLAAAAACTALCQYLPTSVPGLAAKTVVVFALFPWLLFRGGVFSSSEWSRVRALALGRLRLRPRPLD